MACAIGVVCSCTGGPVHPQWRPGPAAHQVGGSVEHPVEHPVEHSLEHPVEQPVEQPVEHSVGRSVGHSLRRSWRIPARAAGGIEGYANRASVTAGQPVTLYVSTSRRRFTVRAFRMGWYGGAEGRQVWVSASVVGHEQAAAVLDPAATRTVRAPWKPSLIVPTRGWQPGDYLLRLEAGHQHESFIPLTVRNRSAAGRVVLISPVTTWQAYNRWGCCDLYEGSDGSFATRSRAVSFDRPYLMQDGSGEFLRGELPIVAEAERLKLPLDYLTDVDLEQHTHILDGARAVISMAHDEYWSPTMRAALAQAARSGTNIAFFGANGIFRRIRFANTPVGPDRLQINYKVAAEDPLFGVDNSKVTADWPSPPGANPESSLLGDQYACNIGAGANVAGVIVAPHSWIFAGTYVTRGELLPGLIGPETDAVQPSYPTPRPIEVLLHSPTSCPSGSSGPNFADTSYYVTAGNAGVFDAGTIDWVCAIRAACPFPISRRTETVIRDVTDNLLRIFSIGPAGDHHPAHDNLAALGISATDPLSP